MTSGDWGDRPKTEGRCKAQSSRGYRCEYGAGHAGKHTVYDSAAGKWVISVDGDPPEPDIGMAELEMAEFAAQFPKPGQCTALDGTGWRTACELAEGHRDPLHLHHRNGHVVRWAE